MEETIIIYKRYCPYCGNEGVIGWNHCDGFYGCKNLVTCSKCSKEYVVAESFVEGYPISGLEWLKKDPRVESITTKGTKESKV